MYKKLKLNKCLRVLKEVDALDTPKTREGVKEALELSGVWDKQTVEAILRMEDGLKVVLLLASRLRLETRFLNDSHVQSRVCHSVSFGVNARIKHLTAKDSNADYWVISEGFRLKNAVLERVSLTGNKVNSADFEAVSADGLAAFFNRFDTCEVSNVSIKDSKLVDNLFVHTMLYESEFIGCDIGINRYVNTRVKVVTFMDSSLWKSTFVSSELLPCSFVRSDLTGSLFHRTSILGEFVDTVLKGAQLQEVSLSSSSFTRSNFTETVMVRSIFNTSTFVECDFTDAFIKSSTFNGCTFTKCTFSGITNKGTTFVDCKFTDCVDAPSNTTSITE